MTGIPGRVGRFLGSALTASTFLLIGTAGGPAHADPGPDDTTNAADGTFLNALHGAGIKYGQPDQAVKAGRTLCDLADNGKTDEEILAILMKHNDNLSNAHANTFMDIAYRTYCPQYMP